MTSSPATRGIGVRDAVARLRKHQQRVTPARLAILEVLDDTEDHLDATEIVNRAAERAPGVHRATVYRALSTLCDLGIVSHTHVAGGAAVYHITVAPAGDRRPHVHLQCSVCGRLIDLPAEVLEPLMSALRRDLGFRLEPEHAALLGTCADCS